MHDAPSKAHTNEWGIKMAQTFHSVSAVTTSVRVARQVAAGLRSMGLDAESRPVRANIEGLEEVKINYPEGRDLNGYLACLEILEDMISAAEARLS